jgi:hypothetical protein
LGSGEAWEPIGKRGECHSLARRDEDSMRVVRGNGPFQGPSGTGKWVTANTQDVVRRTGKEIYREKLDRIT